MKQTISERIELQQTRGLDDVRVGLELDYNGGNRIIFANILWSAVVFLIALLI